jgi:glycerol dehydrogenase
MAAAPPSAAVAFQSPKYVQQAGALTRVGEFVLECFPAAVKAGVIISQRSRARYGEQLCASLRQPVMAEFSGECSRSNLDALLAKLRSQQLDVIVGFGGGKLLDMAKLVRRALAALLHRLARTGAYHLCCTAQAGPGQQ